MAFLDKPLRALNDKPLKAHFDKQQKAPAGTRQQGVALVVILILTTLILISLSGIFYRHQLDLSSAQRVFTGEQAILLALSGESWVKSLLEDDRAANNTDSLRDDWAQRIPPLPVEGGLLTGCVVDLQGRFNINSLSLYDPPRWESELGGIGSTWVDTYLNILALLGLESSELRAAVVIDWMDSDRDLLVGGSAEDPEYQSARPFRLAANQLMVTTDELPMLAGYSAADALQLRPYLSALPRVTPINVNTASPLVLTALLPFVSERVVDQILDRRPFDSRSDLKAFIAQTSGYLSQQEVDAQLPNELVSVDSSFFGLYASISIGGVLMRLESLIYRPDSGPAQVLSRHFETLPSIPPSVELRAAETGQLRDPCGQEERVT